MFKLTKKILIVFAFITGIFLTVNFALAQGADTLGLQYGSTLNLNNTDPRIIIVRIIQYAFGFLGIIAVSIVIYAGFLWMTSGGDEEKVDKAKNILKQGVIGLIIILSAFSIATFVLSRLTGSNNGNGNQTTTTSNPNGLNGVGTLGECTVERVYPTPDQKELPRNTSILVTFTEEVDPATICNNANGCQGDSLNTNNVEIYKTKDTEANVLTNIKVYSNDNKTFIFSPTEYFGSPSEYIWYTVKLTSGIKSKSTGVNIFKNCRNFDFMEWQFEVSNKIDLTPPQVENNGTFPLPDNARDGASNIIASVQATGSIAVNAQPQVYTPATVVGTARGTDSPNIQEIKADANSVLSGDLKLAVLSDGATATLSSGSTSLGSANFSGHTITFPGIFSLTTDNDVKAGSYWMLTATAVKQADTLTVSQMTYVFASTVASPNQIAIGADVNATASNIATTINKMQTDVTAGAASKYVGIKAALAGQSGNDIVLKASNSASLAITFMHGGSDESTTVTQNDKLDQPRNAVIQINFNEPILPLTVSGSATDVKNTIRIVNAKADAKTVGQACALDADCKSFTCSNKVCSGDNDYLLGNFVVANQYKTIEFVSNNQCGVNGCGEPIYCLPENSDLRVELVANDLIACSSDNDCVTYSPYNKCSNARCVNSNGENYPVSDKNSFKGITDIASNSLDGNRDGNAVGPINFFSENDSDKKNGDNFSWYFFINDKIEATPPTILSATPALKTSSGLISDVTINFSKLMMLSTMTTGATKVTDSQGAVTEHKNINIWSLAKQGLGYWIESQPVLVNGSPVKTTSLIKHSPLNEAVSYRSQVGSGVKDIYQNCFKPSAGPACTGVGDNSPSCCNGTVEATLGSDGNCQ